MKSDVVQLTGSENVLSRSMRFMTPNLARASEGFCNSCVIPPMEFPKILRQEFLDSTHLLHQTCTYGQRSSRYVAAAPRDCFTAIEALLRVWSLLVRPLIESPWNSRLIATVRTCVRKESKLPRIRYCVLRSF